MTATTKDRAQSTIIVTLQLLPKKQLSMGAHTGTVAMDTGVERMLVVNTANYLIGVDRQLL